MLEGAAGGELVGEDVRCAVFAGRSPIQALGEEETKSSIQGTRLVKSYPGRDRAAVAWLIEAGVDSSLPVDIERAGPLRSR